MEMKRYIRTEDGLIIDRDKEAYPFTIVDDYIDFNSYGMFKIKSTADTIGELCDEFVLCENNHCCVIGDIEAREMAATNSGIIYGAIWTDKGLIYIMKMNDKGEFELL